MAVPGMGWLQRAWEWIRSLLSWGAGNGGDAEPAVTKEPDAAPAKDPVPPSPAIKAVQDVRDDLGGYGTAIGVGSASIIGIATVLNFDSLFPLPPNPYAYVLVVVVIGAAVVGPILLTQRFFSARRRILIDTQEYGRSSGGPVEPLDEKLGGLSPKERALIQTRFSELAQEEGARDVVVLEARAERLARVSAVARGLDNQTAARALAESTRLEQGIRAAIAESALHVIERRSARVYRGQGTIFCALLAALGASGMFAVTAWSAGEQEQLAAWVKCQSDLKDKEQSELREAVCGRLDPGLNALPATTLSPSPSSEESPTDEKPVLADTAVLDRLRTCMEAPPPTPIPPSAIWEQAIAACAGVDLPVSDPIGATAVGAGPRD